MSASQKTIQQSQKQKQKKVKKTAATNAVQQNTAPKAKLPSTVKRKGRGAQRRIHFDKNLAEPAQSTRENIMVEAPVTAGAIEAMPLAIIARAIVFGLNDPASPVYWAYLALMQDIISILSNKISPVPSRLRYLNEIIQSWFPKTVPFKTGTLSYAWSGVSGISPNNNSINVRGYNTYLYVPSLNAFGPWYLQVPPPNPSDDDQIYNKLSTVFTTVGREGNECLQYEARRDTSEYSTDTSAFASVSSYYGGDTVPSCGPSFSVENEVPFKSRLFAGATTYSIDSGRVARVFGLSSGGPTEAVGYPFLPGFEHRYFKTAYPPQYKFIDLDEVCVVLAEWYMRCVGLISATKNGGFNEQTDYCLTPFNYTAQQFRILVRQAVLAFMGPSQSLAQCMTYTDDRNGFEPFRTGSNTAPVNRYEMRMPETLVENLRMLLPAYGRIDGKFQNNKNVVIYVPVWGIYKSVDFVPYNAVGTLYDVYQNEYVPIISALFNGNYGDDPNPIDGTGPQGEVVDLNSPLIARFLSEWNDRVTSMGSVGGPTAFLAGSAPTTLLVHNRYCSYVEGVQRPMSEVPPFFKRRIPKSAVKMVVPKRTPVARTNSATATLKQEEAIPMYVPPDFSLFTQVDNAYASMTTITEELRNLFQYVIIPSIALTPGEAPKQKSVRTQNLESDVLDMTKGVDEFSSRAVSLGVYAGILAPGLAAGATSDELVALIHKMATTGEGGFLGELLLGAANVILPILPF